MLDNADIIQQNDEMNTSYCYAAFSWRVFQNNRFVGYVVAFSQYDAYNKARDKYGDYIWLEKVIGQMALSSSLAQDAALSRLKLGFKSPQGHSREQE